jgi:hypothetical protein
MKRIIKKILKIILPNKATLFLYRLKIYLIFAKNYLYDLNRYWRYSSTFDIDSSKAKYEGHIIFLYHSIEKGLSLHNPRVGFGKNKVNELIKEIDRAHELFGPSENTETAFNSLCEYYEFNRDNGWENKDLKNKIDKMKKVFTQHFTHEGGTILTGSMEIIKHISKCNFEEFLNCRYSIRDFT